MYHEEPYQNPYVGSIAELIQEPARARAQALQIAAQAQAHAAEVSGQAYGSALSNTGQAIGGAIQTATNPQHQLEAQQVAANQNALKFGGVVNGIVSNLTQQNPDGTRTLDRGKLQQQMAAQNVPIAIQQQTFKSLDDVDKSIQTFNQARTDHLADLAHGVLESIQGGSDPQTALAMGMALAKANGVATDQQLAPIAQAVAGGADIKSVLQQIRGQSEKYKDLSKPVILPGAARPGAAPSTLVNPVSGQTLATGAQAGPAPPTEAGLANDAAGGNPQAAAAMNLLKPKPTDTSGADDARFEKIQTAANLKQPVSPEDLAWAQSYVTRKTIGPQASAAAAADRQAATMSQQNGIQQRTQDFQIAQAGRKELTEKVEQPYQTAVGSANTLRDVVAAAQAGNKVAGSLQSLETTMSAIRAQGLNRINSAEIGVTANAGSLWDRLVGWAGKADAGQPVPANIQKDMTDFADILEKAAYKKYSDGFDATTKRYKLTDEQKMTAPGAPTANGPIQVGGFTVKVK